MGLNLIDNFQSIDLNLHTVDKVMDTQPESQKSVQSPIIGKSVLSPKGEESFMQCKSPAKVMIKWISCLRLIFSDHWK